MKDDRYAIASQFHIKFNDWVNDARLQLGKDILTTDELNAIQLDLLTSGEIEGPARIFDPDRLRFEVKPGETFFVDDVDRIPQRHIDAATDALEAQGVEANDDNIKTMYNQWLTLDRRSRG